jgi:hypothetical protein
MSEKSDTDDFDEDDAEESVADGDDSELDHLIRDVEKQRRKAAKGTEPPWRRLERVMEEKRTAELLSDFEDYDIGDDDGDGDSSSGAKTAKRGKSHRSHKDLAAD